ncbi:MAG TPA: (Fe-S)-binding protein [Candidatus Methanoperedens sp.]
MTFNLFVLPFLLGAIFLIGSVTRRYMRWIKALDQEDKEKLINGVKGTKLLSALKEIFFESLLHRKMFRKNKLLGYMHMSFAFGWLMLIVMGNLESRIYSGLWINPPYYPIFLKFFIHDKNVLPFEIFTVPGFFRFMMDLLLVFVLSGLVLAIIKRSRSNWFGIKRTTTLQLTDKVAMACLWLIFPLRLMAESFTAGAYGFGGGFVTQHVGNVLAFIWPLPDKYAAYTFWWFYSLSLGIFFITLPYSRYMHIPVELLLILLRKCGIQPKKEYSVFSEIEVMSCPRCGVCIDVCQMSSATEVRDAQAAYYIRSIRDEQIKGNIAMKCLVCGRCQDICPVGIGIDSLHLVKRRDFFLEQAVDHSYLKNGLTGKADVIYFAGCMTHLTPSVIHAMKGILVRAGINYLFLDSDKTVCCGRPMMLAWKYEQASAMIEITKKSIGNSSAKLLVTSCPICYRMFREEYGLSIKVQHHSQFLLDLIKTGKIPLQAYFRKVVYHDPCDLGRGTREYGAPRELLSKVADLIPVNHQNNDSLCCGGSLGMFTMPLEQRNAITREALTNLLENAPEVLATACPLCKKTFAKFSPVDVKDISELVYDSIPDK